MLQCANGALPGEGLVLVLCTCPSEAIAGHIAHDLVSGGLAACVNQLPAVRSLYRWEGQVLEEPETLLLIKTLAGRLEALELRVRSLHPYEVPEIIAVPVSAGSAPYLAWLAAG